MDLDLVLLISAAIVLGATALRLVRFPVRQTWDSWLMLAVPTAAGAVVHLTARGNGGAAFWVVFVVVILMPIWALRASGRALRWGRIDRARAFATVAWLVRPFGSIRRFRHFIELAWRIDRGQTFDIDAALRDFGEISDREAAVERFALLSWRSDFDTMAEAIRDPRTRSELSRLGMTSVVLTVLGETTPAAAFAQAYRELTGAKRGRRDAAEEARTLLAGAAYLAEIDTVEEQVADLVRDAPPSRAAFWRATVLQRAGRPEAAAQIVRTALAERGVSRGTRARLERRLEQPLEPLEPSAEVEAALRAIRKSAYARRALGALAFRKRRPAPLMWAILLSLLAAYGWQLALDGQESVVVGGLAVPFDRAPDAYRLLSHAWLHADGVHLAVNTLGLWFFGRFVEQHFGALRMFLLYVLSAIGGGLGLLLLRSEPAVAVGASGAVFGLIAATAVIVALDRTLRQTAEGRRELAVLGFIAAVQLVVDTLLPFSAGSAHLGGLVTGLAVAVVLRPRAAP